MRHHNNYRRRPRRDGTTQRIDQVRSSIARIATPVNGLCSVLGEIEKRSNELLEKGKAARFVDKGRDSGKVVKLVEQLRDAITHYQVSEDLFVSSSTAYTVGQVSQQQAIYDQITNLTVRNFQLVFIIILTVGSVIKSSFNTLLSIHEVTRVTEPVAIFANSLTEIHVVEEQAGFHYCAA